MPCIEMNVEYSLFASISRSILWFAKGVTHERTKIKGRFLFEMQYHLLKTANEFFMAHILMFECVEILSWVIIPIYLNNLQINCLNSWMIVCIPFAFTSTSTCLPASVI